MISEIRLFEDIVGYLSWSKQHGYASFRYDSEFISKGLEISPIHLSIKNAGNNGARVFSFPGIDSLTFSGLPGVFADSLPDNFGNRIIDLWTQKHNHKRLNPVEKLCYINNRGMGALEYYPAQFTELQADAEQNIKIEELEELIEKIFFSKAQLHTYLSDNPSALLDIVKVGTSAGGAVPKAIIAVNKQNNHVISGHTSVIPKGYEHWIIKFDGIGSNLPNQLSGLQSFDFQDSSYGGRIEFIYCKMAKNAGISIPECRLFEEENHVRAHFMIKRFDRTANNEKVHMLTLAGMGHFGWNPVGQVEYDDIFTILRQINAPYSDHEQMFRRMVFNVLGCNLDDHVKNTSFLMDSKSGKWRLSPAYDISYSVNSNDLLGEMHKLSINGKREDIRLTDLHAVAKRNDIKKPDSIINKVIDSLHCWPELSRENFLPENIINSISKSIKNNISNMYGA